VSEIAGRDCIPQTLVFGYSVTVPFANPVT